MKILVVRFSSIGDIVLTTPVVRCLATQLPDAEIHFLTKPAYQTIVSANPHIHSVHVLRDWKELMAELKAENFDYLIDLHHNLRTLRLKRELKGVKHFSFAKLNTQKWLLTALKVNVLPKEHIVDRYLKAAAPLGIVNDGRGLDFFIPAGEEVPNDRIPLSHCAGYVAVVIGATYQTKKLPVHKLIALCKAIDYPVMLLGGKEDAENGENIAAFNDVKVFNACGKFSLNESADLVRKAKLVISHDTGLMHIAAAFNKPIISVWGNTVPAFGMTPYYGEKASYSAVLSSFLPSHKPQSAIAEVKHLYCRPCSKIGYKKCPLGHFKCMEKQDIAAINRMVIKMLFSPAGI